MTKRLVPVLLLLTSTAALANDPPSIDYPPALCTLVDKPIALCAVISDDGQVAVARVYFRREGSNDWQRDKTQGRFYP